MLCPVNQRVSMCLRLLGCAPVLHTSGSDTLPVGRVAAALILPCVPAKLGETRQTQAGGSLLGAWLDTAETCQRQVISAQRLRNQCSGSCRKVSKSLMTSRGKLNNYLTPKIIHRKGDPKDHCHRLNCIPSKFIC